MKCKLAKIESKFAEINNVSLLEITNKRKIQVKRFKQGPIDLLWDCIEICEKVDSEKERLFLWENSKLLHFLSANNLGFRAIRWIGDTSHTSNKTHWTSKVIIFLTNFPLLPSINVTNFHHHSWRSHPMLVGMSPE